MEPCKGLHDDIPADIDFSSGTRGKFAKPGATLKLPVYLEADVEVYLSARAIDMGQLVNELLLKDIELTKAAG